MSIDKFLNRVPGPNYNCASFVREVWLDLVDKKEAWHYELKLQYFVAQVNGGNVSLSTAKLFKPLEHPISPCFVLMRGRKLKPHVGIFLNGRVLHLQDHGAEYQPVDVAKRRFTDIRYYI